MFKEKTELRNDSNNTIISTIILESKPYIEKSQQIEWIKYVKNAINSTERIQEITTTSYIIQKLGSNELGVEDSVELLKQTDFSLDSMYRIVNSILYFYKDGPKFFRTFYKDYLNPQFESIIEQIELRNNSYLKNNKTIVKNY